jgi:DNA modification methylase
MNRVSDEIKNTSTENLNFKGRFKDNQKLNLLILAAMAGGINRFNRLSSKEWLPFQKSWFRYTDPSIWIGSNFGFFTTREETEYPILYHGTDPEIAASEAGKLGFTTIETPHDASLPIQFAFLDYTREANEIAADQWPELRSKIENQAAAIFKKLLHRRFLMVALPNRIIEGKTYPFAWDMASRLGCTFTLKDEKVACLEEGIAASETGYFNPSRGHFYTLYFRKDEQSGVHRTQMRDFYTRISHNKTGINPAAPIPSWFILRPQRRKKNEVIHPAKFPEDLTELFIQALTKPGDNVFDPMSGTGSTQVAALMHSRNGYGVELSSLFAETARQRCLTYLFDASKNPTNTQQLNSLAFDIIQGDARKSTQYGFPMQDLIVTSPPYWDMLNMKGAENQAKRIKQGLQTNYSDDENDLGNISDYDQFIDVLTQVYFDVIELLKPGGHMVVVVKNIKKKGKNYPFAWDLAALLQKKLILMPETFWCQDDISIAPYGYGNTFVSNTFHQYCLLFQKPLS